MEAATSLDSSSSEDLDDICIDHEIDDIDISSVAPRKPHFLDYDAVPPPGFEDNIKTILTPTSSSSNGCCGDGYPGEKVKIDKKYERDGEISDYELAASGVTKRELTPQHKKISQQEQSLHQQHQQIQQQHQQQQQQQHNQKITGARKKKHFLDENPIPPDYMLDKNRENNSLDRNFDRSNECEGLKYDRKYSLDSEHRIKKVKEPSYTLSRFIENDVGPSYRGTWPVEKPSENVINYSSMPPVNMSNLGPKVECVYSLLSMLGSHDSIEMSKKFLELSRTTETCATLRRSGCIPLLVQMMHSDGNESARKRAAAALHNVVHCHPDDKAGRREAKVLRLIEQIMDYCNFLKTFLMSGGEAIADDSDRHPLAAISSLMKVSFDEEHRHAMCQLGALQAIASLVHLDHAVHGPKPEDQCCNSLRRYALMALTNLTFGDGNNKALLCANKEFMEALVAQLNLAPDDLLQVTASVLRNLSWRADNNMKAVLNEIGTVTALAKAAMKNKNENTLKAILSALWNLSAHCSTNKAEFCAVEGALAFLVDMLTYEGPSKTLKIIENAGGILRNLSSHIAIREDYRRILRQRNCLGILLQQLKSESLTVVSNACGTLWNLSARCPEDQKYLWDNGAVPMLRSLIHSKHKMISEGSSAALKNLLNFRPGALNQNNMDPIAKAMGLKELPTLNARKQRALEQELNRNLAETCENLDVITPPKEKIEFTAINSNKNISAVRLTRSAVVSKSESKDSIISVKSDSVYEKSRRGHSAPPLQETVSKDKSHAPFNLHDDFVTKREFDVEQVEQPIDYSAKYNIESSSSQKATEQLSVHAKGPRKQAEARNYSEYQETDLDQPTDFSLRYAENQVESDVDEKATTAAGNEIILILEDTVKCYQTEDTPYVISNAGSITDLRNPKTEEVPQPAKRVLIKAESGQNDGSGTYTPEKPINYCEEGTPGYFSRYESLSSLDESPPNCNTTTKVKPEVLAEEPPEKVKESPEENVKATQPKSERQKVLSSSSNVQGLVSGINRIPINSAQETPLMFSRRSSMDSLASAEPITADDKSSVVSDFSRLASGVISPSELPDSPTQSMPQSPRRSSHSGIASYNPSAPIGVQRISSTQAQQRLRSVFEDDTNTFQVENTPAQFSCATSLSNLSLDDEPKIATDTVIKELILMEHSPEEIVDITKSDKKELNENNSHDKNIGSCAISDGEEATNDDLLLATCINMGMNKGTSTSKLASLPSNTHNVEHSTENTTAKEIAVCEDMIKQYCTEDTPALMSKVGSNSNLSALSMSTNKDEVVNLTDESSNASDGGSDLLEQCIREGMQKTTISKHNKIERKLPNHSDDVAVSGSITSPVVNTTITKDPIAMLRRGGLPPYLPVRDEMSKFVVEDSPCNYSLLSGLSNLTIGSSVAGPAKRLSGPESDKKASVIGTERKQLPEDSLSSISIESEDDTNLLSQTIAAGFNKVKSHPSKKCSSSISSSSKRNETHQINFNEAANDSLSSVDSSDSNDYQAKSLFEQCIHTGMNKQKKVEKSSVPKQVITSPKRSHLPTLSHTSAVVNIKTPIKVERDKQKDRIRKDEQLLRECINTGIAKSVRTDQNQHIKPPTKHIRQVLAPTDFSQRLVTGASMEIKQTVTPSNTTTVPKNGETTSVAVLEQHQLVTTIYQSAPNTAPGVGMREPPEGISTVSKNQSTILLADPHQQIGNIRAPQRQNITGSNLFQISQNSLNLSGDGFLDQSNEYPALKCSAFDVIEDSVNESSFEMEVSNEFLIEKDDSDEELSNSQKIIHDKHKDPDLMLKSVERLTLELVSTAEYLRRGENECQDSEINSTMYDRKSGSNSNSNNTWNEDTCPNDVSFPSISLTAPIIASFNDDEATISEAISFQKENNQTFVDTTPVNETKIINVTFDKYENFNETFLLREPEPINSQPNSLETETDTLINDETDGGSVSSSSKNLNSNKSGQIQFKVGGEVQKQPLSANINQFGSPAPMSFEISSAMSNSTIIAMEAKKLAQDIMRKMSESTTSLDLDNVRPPSGMENLSISGCFDIPQSPQLSKLRKKSLPAGLMARRALAGGQGQNFAGMTGSMESVNSSYNLDNIKPPSLMDELLDSMISVDSITSEIVDNQSLGIATNYETAFSDIDENTTTLQSCMDALLPNDTPIPSDFSSAESTPRKSQRNMVSGIKRNLTPKQKRRVIKDRYKTYTIAADYVLKEDYRNLNKSDQRTFECDEEDDEIIRIEIEHGKNEPENELQENCLEITQVVEGNVEDEKSMEPSQANSSKLSKRRLTDPDRYKTRTIIYKAEKEEVGSNILSHQNIEFESMTSTEDSHEEETSLHALTKQFKSINVPGDYLSTHIEEKKQVRAIPINSLIRAKIIEEEKRTTTVESDYNSMECDQNSETESCDQNNIKVDDYVNESPKKIPKSITVKTNDKDSGTEINCSEDSMTPPETVKTVRGRKKPAYVSPYNKSVLSNSSSRTTSPKSQNGITVCRTNLATKNISPEVKKTFVGKSIPRNQTIIAKTHVLVNKSNLTQKVSAKKSGIGKLIAKTTSNIPSTNKSALIEKNLINKKLSNEDITSSKIPKVNGLERQGTFVKEEPSIPEVPVVGSLPTSPVKTSKLPTKSGIVKPTSISKSPIKTVNAINKPRQLIQKSVTNTKHALNTSSSKQRPNSVNTTSDSPKKKTFLGIRKSSVPIAPQRSNSNASIRTTSILTALKTNLPSTTPPSRSNSNLTSGKPTGISSRIAGIWKKDENKKFTSQQQQQQSCTTKLITTLTAGKPPLSVSKTKLNSKNSNLNNISDNVVSTATPTDSLIQKKANQNRKTGIATFNTGTFLIRRGKKINQNAEEKGVTVTGTIAATTTSIPTTVPILAKENCMN